VLLKLAKLVQHVQPLIAECLDEYLMYLNGEGVAEGLAVLVVAYVDHFRDSVTEVQRPCSVRMVRSSAFGIAIVNLNSVDLTVWDSSTAGTHSGYLVPSSCSQH